MGFAALSPLLSSSQYFKPKPMEKFAAHGNFLFSVEGYGVVDKQARMVYDGVLPFEIFERGEDALAWLERQLIPEY